MNWQVYYSARWQIKSNIVLPVGMFCRNGRNSYNFLASGLSSLSATVLNNCSNLYYSWLLKYSCSYPFCLIKIPLICIWNDRTDLLKPTKFFERSFEHIGNLYTQFSSIQISLLRRYRDLCILFILNVSLISTVRWNIDSFHYKIISLYNII